MPQTNPATTTLNAFIDWYRIKMRAQRTDSNPHMDNSRDMDHWRVTLRCRGRQMTLVFSQGYGHQGAEPTLNSVLDCLASDASGAEGRDFEEWASELGYDVDSRRAERTYRAIERQIRQLGRLLGPEAYAQLLYDVERE